VNAGRIGKDAVLYHIDYIDVMTLMTPLLVLLGTGRLSPPEMDGEPRSMDARVLFPR
jgi:hypothetical protein